MDESIPRIIGYVDVPEIPALKGRSVQRSALVRVVLSSLTPGKALALECPTKDEMQTFRCWLLVGAKQAIRTMGRGNVLYVFLKESELCFFPEEANG